MIAVAGLSGCSRPSGNERTRVPDSTPSDWAFRQRTFPHGRYSPTAYAEAYEAVADMQKTSKTNRITTEWELAGPTNIGGRITDVEFDPMNPDVVYTSAATGGVFKSTDKGETWASIFDGYAVVNVGDIGISKSNPSTIYVGTGEANGGANNLQGAGVFKSVDAGETWNPVGLYETAAIGRIVIHPDNENQVYVAAVGSYFDPSPDRGVFRSQDGGETWENVLFISDTTGAIDLVMNPENPDILYAAMWHRWRHPTVAELGGRTSGVYRSLDGGDTWAELGPETGLPDPKAEGVGRIGLAIHEADPDILYAVYSGPRDGSHVYTGLYKTTDGGESWIDFDPNDAVDDQFHGGFSWFFGQVRVSPVDPDRVYVMEVEFQHTRNGGQTWLVNIGGKNLHVDHHALAFHPEDPEYVISGNDGGLNISEDGGVSWRKIRGLPITQFYEIEIDSRDPRQLYGGTQDNQTVMTPTGGVDDWVPLELPVIGAGGDGFYVKVIYEPLGYQTIYAESQFGALFKSIAGDEFRSVSPSLGDRRNWNTPYIFPPDSSSTLYYGTHSLYKSGTRGTTWSRVSPQLADDWPFGGFGTISTIDIAPSMRDAIIVGTDDGHVWVTADDGANWQDVSAGLPQRWVTRVKFHPENPMVAYATFSGLKWNEAVPHVFRTDNFGSSWVDVSGNLPDAPVNAFAIDPIDTQIIYVGTDVGAFVHFDGGYVGSGWEILGGGLPAVAVYDMKVNAEPHFMVAGTHGRSMFKLDLSDLVATSIVEGRPGGEILEGGFRLDGSYPNPFTRSTTIRFETASGGQLSVAVYDLGGRVVANLLDGRVGAGLTEVVWDGRMDSGEPASSGTYLYRIAGRDGRFTETGSMMLVR